jgi:hypothetical protein
MFNYRILRTILPVALFLAVSTFLPARQEPKLSEEQIREFLRTAEVVDSRHLSKGVTAPYRLTLTNGAIKHDAGFNYVSEDKAKQVFSDGGIEFNFKDSYRYDIAAYELAKLLGLGDMMPVTVERVWGNKWGAISWWIPTKMDELTRRNKKIKPPNPDAWNKQMHKIRIFDELVCNTDANRTNVLITDDWRLYMIDFTRAFRLDKEIRNKGNITESMCERNLLERLKHLDRNELAANTKYKKTEYLSKGEIDGVMARRDRIVTLYMDLIAKKGEKEVLYDDPVVR